MAKVKSAVAIPFLLLLIATAVPLTIAGANAWQAGGDAPEHDQSIPADSELDALDQEYLAENAGLSKAAEEMTPAVQSVPGYAGIWIEHKDGQRLVVVTAGELSEMESAVEPYRSPEVEIVIRLGEHDLTQLDATVERIRQDEPRWLDQGIEIVQFGVDIPSNRVKIQVQNLTSDAGLALQNMYGAIVEVEEGEKFTTLACTARANCYPPAIGGVFMRAVNAGGSSTACTSGFRYKDPGWQGGYYMLTAGHCIHWQNYYGGTAQNWCNTSSTSACLTTTGSFMGTALVTSFDPSLQYRPADAGYIYLELPLTSPQNQVYGTTNIPPNNFPIIMKIGNAGQISGTIVCANRGASATNYACGQITIADQNVKTAASPPVIPNDVWLAHQWLVAITGIPGDSGSPIVLSDGSAFGIMVAGGSGSTAYSTLDWVDSWFGKKLCTSASC